MKFGKHLRRVREISNPAWSNAWMDYKMLKRLIKAASRESESPTPLREATPQTLAGIPEERAFFTALLQNLRKVNEFYQRSLRDFEERVAEIEMAVSHAGAPPSELMARCRDIYLQLLMLENFVVINYCGFSKILKKHDKNTGWQTRDKYMAKMVNPLPFSHYHTLRALVQRVEAQFQRLLDVQPKLSNKRPRLASEDEAALEELHSMRRETTSLADEDGSGPPSPSKPCGAGGGGPDAGGPGPAAARPPRASLAERALSWGREEDPRAAVAFAFHGMAADEALAVEVLANASSLVHRRPGSSSIGRAADAGARPASDMPPPAARAGPAATPGDPCLRKRAQPTASAPHPPPKRQRSRDGQGPGASSPYASVPRAMRALPAVASPSS